MPFVMKEEVKSLREQFQSLSKQIHDLVEERDEVRAKLQAVCEHELICVDLRTGGYKFRICEICAYEEHRDKGPFKNLRLRQHVRQAEDWYQVRDLDFEPEI